MRKARLFAVVMAAVMTLSLAACGGQQEEAKPSVTPEPTKTEATPIPTPEPTKEASIDFEDGNYGFVMMSTKKRKADDSNLSIANYNGSKALYVERVENDEMYVGIDIDAFLGSEVTKVRTISVDVGTEHSDGNFASTAGYLTAYVGEDLKETQLEGWSVYMKNKNPKTVTFTLPEDVAFTAGNDNYVIFSKLEDNGAVISNLYLDNIRFMDANGNVLKGDTSVVMEPVAGFLKRAETEDETPSGASDVKVALDDSYKGDWSQTTSIPAEAFASFSGDVTVTFKFELVGGYDYYLWAPMSTNDWAKLGSAKTGLPEKTAAEEGDLYHMQADGSIVIDDQANNTLSFTIKAEDVAAIVAAGGLCGQTYGVTTFEAVLSDPNAGGMTEKVALDDSYKGDWSQTTAIPAEVLSKFAGSDVTVTFKFELTGGYDYYLWAPMSLNDWAKLGSAKTGLPEKTEAEEGVPYHMQADGSIVIDDQTKNEITFTIKAADLDAIIAAGGLCGQTYGVTTYEAVVTGGSSSAMKEKVALDDSYKGDWSQTTAIPADVLAKYPDGVTVTWKIELAGGYDYYLIAPMSLNDWAKLGSAKTGLPEKAAAEEGDLYHMQADGSIVIDDLTNDSITFTLSADVVAELVAAGGLCGQTYGVTVYEAVLE